MNDKMVFIEWNDSAGDHRWMDRNAVIAGLSVSECISVGFLLYRDEEKIIISQSIDKAGVDNVSHSLVIPMVNVKKVQELRRK